MDRTWMRVLIWIAIAGLVAIDAVYVSIIHLQGGPDPPDVLTVPFVAIYLAMMALLLGASLFAPASTKPFLRAPAAAGLLVMGVIAAFSIGLLVLVIAGLAIAVTVATPIARRRTLLAAGIASVAALAVLIGGLQFSWHFIVCPATGSSGGTTAGFLSQTTYTCDNGVLTTR